MKMKKKDAIVKLSQFKTAMNIADNTVTAERNYKLCCRYNSAINPFYCGSRSCEQCSYTKMYNNVLQRIAFADYMRGKREEVTA